MISVSNRSTPPKGFNRTTVLSITGYPPTSRYGSGREPKGIANDRRKIAAALYLNAWCGLRRVAGHGNCRAGRSNSNHEVCGQASTSCLRFFLDARSAGPRVFANFEMVAALTAVFSHDLSPADGMPLDGSL
jgi:hypothetical protein